MFAVTSYEEIERNERALNKHHIIVLLFVRPSLPGADSIIREFNYIHHNTRDICSVYAVGFRNDARENRVELPTGSGDLNEADWQFSDRDFVAFKNRLEKRLKNWEYSGEIELLILQSNPAGRNILNFENYISIDVNHGIRESYLESFPRFMESLVRSAKNQYTTVILREELLKRRFKLTEIVADAIGGSKKIPKPVKKIVRDRMFYRTARAPALSKQ